MFEARNLLVSWAIALVTSANGQCYSNTTEILVQQTLATAEERKVYRLCPNTVFQLGPTTIPGKQSPLVARSNTHFLCGPDGSSANNCVLSGGESQFWSHEAIFDGEDVATAVVVQGITFESAQHVAIMLENAGTVTFIDCIIRNHFNAAPVLASFSPLRRRGLASAGVQVDNYNSPLMIRGGNHRQTQASSTAQLNVNFIDCRFVGNRQRNPAALFTYGVITVSTQYHNLNVRNCEFFDNDYSTAEMGYIIRSFEAPVQIYDSCFRNNKLSAGSYGAVEVFSVDNTAAFEALNNFGSYSGGDPADETTCSFAAVSETIPELERQVTCLPFDGDACLEKPPETKPDDASPAVLPPPPKPAQPPTISPTRRMPTKPDIASPAMEPPIPLLPTISPTLPSALETPDDFSQLAGPTFNSDNDMGNDELSHKKPAGLAAPMTSNEKRSSTLSSYRNYNSKGRSISNSHRNGSKGMGGRSDRSGSSVRSNSKMSSSTSSMMMMNDYRYKSKKMQSSSSRSMTMKMGDASSSKSLQERIEKKKEKGFY